LSTPAESNVVPLVVPASQVTGIRLHLSTVDQARSTLTRIEAACALGLATLDKAPMHGDEQVLRGVRQIFAALVALLTS
jgi:hypothetical protein